MFALTIGNNLLYKVTQTVFVYILNHKSSDVAQGIEVRWKVCIYFSLFIFSFPLFSQMFVCPSPSFSPCLSLSVCLCLPRSVSVFHSVSVSVSLSLFGCLSFSIPPSHLPLSFWYSQMKNYIFFFILMTHTVKVWQEDKYYLPQSKGGSGCGILWMLQLWLSHTDWLDNCSEASESPWWVSLTTTEWVYSLNFTHHNTSLPRWNNISNFSFFWSSFRNTFPPFWDCKTLSVLVRNAKFNI